MTRLLFDAGKTVFHFLLPSNSRYLILTGNAKLWGCYPNCSSEFSASGEQSKYEKQSVRNYFPLVVMGSALVFSKSWKLGLALTSQCERDSHPRLGVRRIRDEEDAHALSGDWGRCVQPGENFERISEWPSHIFIRKQLAYMRSHLYIRSPKDRQISTPEHYRNPADNKMANGKGKTCTSFFMCILSL